MKKSILLLVAVMFAAFAGAQTTWTSDPAHSRLGFKVKHLTIAEINGYFSDFTVSVTTTKSDYSDAKIVLSAKTSSINTGIEARDNHLKTADFFDAEKYPEISFTSTSFTLVPNKVSKNSKHKKAIIKGNLTMHGVTKPVVLTATYFGTVTNPMNNQETAGFQITGTLKRSDFGVGPNFPEAVVGDLITIVADAEFSPKK